MTDTDRKVLTEEVLGECWHEIVDKGPYETTCDKCGMAFASIHYSDWDINKFYRTFTIPADLHAVYSKMVEKGEWEELFVYLYEQFRETIKQGERQRDNPPTFTTWLSCYGCPDQIGERMKMAAQFIERRK